MRIIYPWITTENKVSGIVLVWGVKISPNKKGLRNISQALYFICGDPSGTRTRVTGVRGRRPRPLDDGATNIKALIYRFDINLSMIN
jgi:hypothetical protein